MDQAKITQKAPYSQYEKLAEEGVSIQWGDPADAAVLPDGPFDVVYDNNGKALDVCRAAIDKYKVCPAPYCFKVAILSSCAIHKLTAPSKHVSPLRHLG